MLRPGRLRAAAAFVPIALLALLLRAPIADVPLERDEGEYAYIAQRWMAGDVPYRDAFDQKPPGTFAVYALILAGLGSSVEAIHWGAQGWTLGTLALLFILGRRLDSPTAGGAAAALAAFQLADVGVFGNAANTETFMILPLAAAFLATLEAVARNRPARSLLAGAASAAALLFKQVSLPNLVLCALLLLAARRRAVLLASFAAGAAAALLPALGYFAAAGAWDPFVDCVLEHNVKYAAQVPLAAYPGAFRTAMARILITSWPVYALAAWGLIVTVRDRCAPRAEGRLALAAWTAAALVGVAAGGFFRPHYFIQLVPGVALLAGLGAADLGRRLPGVRVARWPPHALAALAVLIGLASAPWYWRPGDRIAKCRRIYGANPFAEAETVGRFLAEHTRPDERVLIFGSEPQILFHAGRRSATRYIFMYPLTAPFDDARRRQRELLDELTRHPPRMAVSIMTPESFGASADTPGLLFAEVAAMLDRDYDVVAVAPLIGDRGRVDWLTGDAARLAFAQRPPPTARSPFWCQLSVWAREGPPATPSRPDAG